MKQKSALNGYGGAPTKLDPERREKILAALRGGLSRQDAASLVGINRTTLYRAQRDNPDFARDVDVAEGEATQTAVAVIWQAVQAGDPRWASWWLAHRRPRQWGDNASASDLDHKDDQRSAGDELLEELSGAAPLYE